MGRIRMKEQTDPATPPAGYIELFTDSADGHFKQIDDTGTVIDLTGGAIGEANTASNVTGSTGVGVFKQKTGVDLEFKSLLEGGGVDVASGTSDVTVSLDITNLTAETSIADTDLVAIYDTSASAHRKMTKANFATGLGTVNTASNVGVAGVGVFKQKTGTDLEFKKVNAGSSKVTITDDTGNNEIDVDIVEANIAHDSLSGYSANRHIDHTSVAINVSSLGGLQGGGTIASTRTIDLDITNLTAETTSASGDLIAIYDVSASAHRKMTKTDFLTGVSGGVTSASNENVDGVGVFKQLSGTNLEFKGIKSENSLLTVTNDAVNNTVDLTVNEGSINHDNLSGFVANEHIDWTSTSSSLSTTGTITGSQAIVSGGASGTEDLSVTSTGTRDGIKITKSGTGDAIEIAHTSTGKILNTGLFDIAASGEATSTTLTGSRALVSGASKEIQSSSVTSTELGHLSGVTSSVQTQLDGKISSSRQVATATGLTGGGDLSADRTIALNFTGLSSDTLAAGDEIAFYDISASSHKKSTWSKINRANTTDALENVGLTAVHSSGTILITLHGADGSALSSTNIARVAFRSTSASSGGYTLVEITANLTLTVSSGATLGCEAINSVPDNVNIYLVFNGSAVQLAVSKTQIHETETLVSTTTMNSSSDDRSTLYSTTGVSNVACRVVGFMRVYESTWGTWTTNPSSVGTISDGAWNWRPGFLSAAKTSGQTITNNSITIVDFDGTTISENIAVTTGSGWFAEIKHAGLYWITSRVTFNSATWGGGNQFALYVYVNGSQRDILFDELSRSYTGKRPQTGITFIRCAPGDRVDVRILQTQGTSQTLTTTATENYIRMTKVQGWDI